MSPASGTSRGSCSSRSVLDARGVGRGADRAVQALGDVAAGAHDAVHAVAIRAQQLEREAAPEEARRARQQGSA